MTNIDILKNWVVALRSGKYKQGKRYLRTSDHFCCLGVLCEINNLPRIEGFSGYRYYSSYSIEELPQLFANKLGIDINPEVNTEIIPGHSAPRHLSSINDNGYSFDEIATLIETQLIPNVREMQCEL